MNLLHKAVEARWDEKSLKWAFKVKNVMTGEVFQDTADALITAIGSLNK